LTVRELRDDELRQVSSGYMKYHLEDVIVSSIPPGGTGGVTNTAAWDLVKIRPV
jgi:hypothetical protein